MCGPEFAWKNIYQCICWIFLHCVNILVPVIVCRAKFDAVLRYILLRLSRKKLWFRMERCMLCICVICTTLTVACAALISGETDRLPHIMFIYITNTFLIINITKIIELTMGVRAAYLILIFGEAISTVMWSFGTREACFLPWSYGMYNTYGLRHGNIWLYGCAQICIVTVICLAGSRIIGYYVEKNMEVYK